ncbi:RHS repeat domain-containing protein [Belliella marina]|uniref:RHS repeat domain-containing protein n=1 Tax=Belliella marina TaxID=1644146 RepID=A0ABW4VQ06_9BACT
MNLKGKVNSVRETSTTKYTNEEPKVRISKYAFNRQGKQLNSDTDEYSHESTYNSEGQIIETKEYFLDRLDKKTIYSYSSEGKKISKSTYMSPTFSSMEEWEDHQAKKHTYPHEGLYLQNKLEIHEDGNQTITVYKQNKEVDHIQKEIYENSKLVEVTVKYPFSNAFGYKKTWKYDQSNNLVKFEKFVGPEERLEFVWEYDYDEKNRITKETHLRYAPKSSSTINENGHLKDQTTGYYLDEDQSFISSFKYDANGSLTSKTGKKYTGEPLREITYELTYDSNQNLIQENIHDSQKGSVKNSIEYDENGNEIFYKSVDSNGDLISKVTRRFDVKSNMTERTVYESDGSISLDESYVFDTNGNVTEHILNKPQEETVEIKTHNYDVVGNWVKFELKLLSSETDEVYQQVIKEREIIYYE